MVVTVFNRFNRIDREKKTVNAMIKLYCRNFHGQNKELCGECSELLYYSFKRLEKVLMGIINQLVLTAPRIATNSRTEKKLEK